MSEFLTVPTEDELLDVLAEWDAVNQYPVADPASDDETLTRLHAYVVDLRNRFICHSMVLEAEQAQRAEFLGGAA